MSTCYKCGRELPGNEVECEDGCHAAARVYTFAQIEQQLARRLPIDWNKVKTFDDLLLIISTIFAEATIDPDSDAAKKLARFLSTPGANENPS